MTRGKQRSMTESLDIAVGRTDTAPCAVAVRSAQTLPDSVLSDAQATNRHTRIIISLPLGSHSFGRNKIQEFSSPILQFSWCFRSQHAAEIYKKQVALLWQRDRATRLSVEILQLQNIPFEN